MFCMVVWLGDEAVSVPEHPTNLDIEGQEPTVLTVGENGMIWIFLL